MDFPIIDLFGWAFEYATHKTGCSGPDDPPDEADEIAGLVYWYCSNGRPFSRFALGADDVITGEEVQDFCNEMDVDPIDLYAAAQRAERPLEAAVGGVAADAVLEDDPAPDDNQPEV